MHTDITLIATAASFAAEAHKGQVRKELNEPYIVHPLRVGAMAGRLGLSATMVAAGFLHDVVEDTPTPIATIEALFGTPVYELVRALTKWWPDHLNDDTLAQNKALYYENIRRTDGAALLKLLDRIDNLRDFERMARMSPTTHKWARRYYQKTTDEFPSIVALVDNMQARTEYHAALSSLALAVTVFTPAEKKN